MEKERFLSLGMFWPEKMFDTITITRTLHQFTLAVLYFCVFSESHLRTDV